MADLLLNHMMAAFGGKSGPAQLFKAYNESGGPTRKNLGVELLTAVVCGSLRFEIVWIVYNVGSLKIFGGVTEYNRKLYCDVITGNPVSKLPKITQSYYFYCYRKLKIVEIE